MKNINIFQLIREMSVSSVALIIVTLMVYVMTIFTAINSNAEVAVSPSSYVSPDGKNVEVVKGQPQIGQNGEKIEYQNSHVIPIQPTIQTRNGDELNIPDQVPCKYPSSTNCDKRIISK